MYWKFRTPQTCQKLNFLQGFKQCIGSLEQKIKEAYMFRAIQVLNNVLEV